jgi:hypothetical protein
MLSLANHHQYEVADMASETDKVFILRNGKMQPVPFRPMKTGILGKSLEEALQILLQKHPEVIPGSQIDPASEEPPKFVLLRREMPVGGWSLDHLLVDQFGVLTLVETKLLQNPESRREVIGQIIEYAANAREAWGSGKVQQYASEYWSKSGKDLGQVLDKAFPENDLEQFWQMVEDNLQHGRIRLIIAADVIRPEVRRMIEYLNSETQNAEVLGLELRAYGENDDDLILVPSIVGQTQEIADRHLPRARQPGELKNAFEKLPKEQSDALCKLLDWSTRNNCFLKSRAQSPVFGIAGKGGDRILTVYQNGILYLFLEEHKYPGGADERDKLLGALKDLGLFDPAIDPNEVISGRNSSRKVWELDAGEFDGLLETLSAFCT